MNSLTVFATTAITGVLSEKNILFNVVVTALGAIFRKVFKTKVNEDETFLNV